METPAPSKTSSENEQLELEEELRRAEADFARGDFVDVTIEELDASIAAGEWPWPHASSA
jgi:hypothetical protein